MAREAKFVVCDQSIYYHFRKWRLDGRLRRAHDRLQEAMREAEGLKSDPSADAIASQVVKTTPVGEDRNAAMMGRGALSGAQAPHSGGHKQASLSRAGPQSEPP